MLHKIMTGRFRFRFVGNESYTGYRHNITYDLTVYFKGGLIEIRAKNHPPLQYTVGGFLNDWEAVKN